MHPTPFPITRPHSPGPHTALRYLPTGEGPFRPSAEYNSGAARLPPANCLGPSPLFTQGRQSRRTSTTPYQHLVHRRSLRPPAEAAGQLACFQTGHTTPQVSAQNIVASHCPPLSVHDALYLRGRGGCGVGWRAGSISYASPSATVVGGPRRATGTEGGRSGRGPLCTLAAALLHDIRQAGAVECLEEVVNP